MGGLKAVNVDKAASTMTVTGAITFGDVLEPLYAAGKEIRKIVHPPNVEYQLTVSKQLAHARVLASSVELWELVLVATKVSTG